MGTDNQLVIQNLSHVPFLKMGQVLKENGTRFLWGRFCKNGTRFRKWDTFFVGQILENGAGFVKMGHLFYGTYS